MLQKTTQEMTFPDLLEQQNDESLTNWVRLLIRLLVYEGWFIL